MEARRARTLGYLTTGEVAELLGTTARTLLYYEEEGLVQPRRSLRGTRFYSEFDIRRLDVCLRLASLDFPLRAIKELANTRRTAATGAESARALVDILDEMRQRSQARIIVLQSCVRAIDEAASHLTGCLDCPRRPTRETCPDCPCEVNLDASYLLHLTADPDRPGHEDPELS